MNSDSECSLLAVYRQTCGPLAVDLRPKLVVLSKGQ